MVVALSGEGEPRPWSRSLTFGFTLLAIFVILALVVLVGWLAGRGWSKYLLTAASAIAGVAINNAAVRRRYERRYETFRSKHALVRRLDSVAVTLDTVGASPWLIVLSVVFLVQLVTYRPQPSKLSALGSLVFPVFLLIVVGFLMFPTFLQRSRRMKAFRKLDPLGWWGALLFVTLFLWLTIVMFSLIGTTAGELDLATYSKGGGGAIRPWDLVLMNAWQLANSVPLAEVPETLTWAQPVEYDGLVPGFLLLSFKVLVIVPVVFTIRDFLKYRSETESDDDTSASANGRRDRRGVKATRE